MNGFSLVIPTYKRPDLLASLLRSLKETEWGDAAVETIVVDNAGCEQTEQICRKFENDIPGLTYLLEREAGLSVARNSGIAACTKHHILLLDDDVTFDRQWHKILTSQISDTEELIYCPRLLCPEEPHWPDWLKQRIASGVGQYDYGGETRTFRPPNAKLPIGAAVAFPRSFFARFGPFDRNLDRVKRQLLGGSDSLFFRKAFQAGVGVRYVADSIVYHHLTAEKQSRKYWIRQGFHGGRSFVRMTKPPVTGRISIFLTSFVGVVGHGILSIFDFSNSFRHVYHGAAHLGRVTESVLWWGNPDVGAGH